MVYTISEWKNKLEITTIIHKTHTEILEFLSNSNIELDSRFRSYEELWFQQSADLFFFNTEFNHFDNGLMLFELCIQSASGQEIINTPIDYNCSIESLYKLAGFDVQRKLLHGTISKVYGVHNKQKTQGLTLDKIADVLEESGLEKTSRLIEWSTNCCDHKVLSSALNSVERQSLMPPWANVLTLIQPYQTSLGRFKISFRLGDLHNLLFPERFLFQKAHRAGADVEMLIQLDGVLNIISVDFAAINSNSRVGKAIVFTPKTMHNHGLSVVTQSYVLRR